MISNWRFQTQGVNEHDQYYDGKGLDFFDECAAKCLPMFPQEEESTSSSWEDRKIYKAGIIANSQTTPTEIKMVLLPKEILVEQVILLDI